MLTNAVALSSKILFGYVHLLVPINNTGNNHMKLRKLVVAVGLSICSPFCFSDIITSGDVSVIDGAFNSYPVDIGPGDTHLGPDLGVFLISTVDQQSSLTVNNGSTLSGAQLVAMSEVDSDGVPIPGVEPAQIIIDGVGSSIQLYHSGPGSAGQIDLSSQGSANLSIVNGGALVFNVSDECGAFECNLGYLSNAAGTNTNIVVSGEGSLLDLAHNAQQRIAIGTASYQVWETSNFGYPGGETNISISIAEGARFETSIAEVSPGWTGPDNTGTESINASIEVTGSGSTWYSESIFLGFGDGAENMSGLSANLTVHARSNVRKGGENGVFYPATRVKAQGTLSRTPVQNRFSCLAAGISSLRPTEWFRTRPCIIVRAVMVADSHGYHICRGLAHSSITSLL